jgi:beta-aspartyl-peptidase (threonine type)
VHGVLRPDDGGIIAVDREGNLVASYNSTGMYRGLADSNGRFEVAIFEK